MIRSLVTTSLFMLCGGGAFATGFAPPPAAGPTTRPSLWITRRPWRFPSPSWLSPCGLSRH